MLRTLVPLKKLEADFAKQGLFTAIPHNLLVKKGNAWSVVSQVLTQRKIDLVVTGTHGRTGLEMFWIGSFAETIFRRARCPVLGGTAESACGTRCHAEECVVRYRFL